MQNGSLTRIQRERGPNVWAYRWREPGPTGKIVYHNLVIGTMEQFPDKPAALKAIAGLKRQINSQDPRVSQSMITVEELVQHYRQRELTPDNAWKTYSTRRGYEGYLRKWALPRWGAYSLAKIKSVEVELWLRSLPLARATCAKIRNVMSVLYNHARRYDLFDGNPITWVRQGAKRRKAPEVLTVAEIQQLIAELKPRERTLVLLDIGTGLRMSELFALKWKDIDFERHQLHVTRSVVYQFIGFCKTEASQKPVPLHGSLAETLKDWRRQTAYASSDDWVFASPHCEGRRPYWGQAIMRHHIHPVLRRLGITKRVGWHTFRHSYSTLLKHVGADLKVMQELLRHASVRVTLDTYTQAVTSAKRAAQSAVLALLRQKRKVSAT